MTDFIQYLPEVILGSSVMFLGYFLFRDKFSIPFRRFYLLGCMILPLLMPLVSFNSIQPEIKFVPHKVNEAFSVTETPQMIIPQDMPTTSGEKINSEPENGSFDWAIIAIIAYCSISMLFILRLVFSLITISKLIRNAHKNENDPYRIVKDKKFSGGSFFNWIFIHEHYLNKSTLDIILAHERVHARYWHSVDLLLSEIYCAFFWINPMAWLIRKEIKLNIEHEADAIVSNAFGKEQYAHMLLQLSVNKQNPGPILSFSAIHIGQRIKHILGEQKHHWSKSLLTIPFLIVATWLISCEPEMMDFTAMDPQTALKNVKTVTTRYISHQRDTQQKDGKIIAIAYYLPVGTVDRVEQHMTYPYDFEKPFKREFLASPDPVGVLHILDGFRIGHAENNILYGNDWPKYNKIDLFRAKSELYRKSTTIDKNEEGLPVKFTLTEELNEDLFYSGTKRGNKGSVVRMLIEEYKYIDGKVLSFTRKSESPESIMTFKNQTYNVGGSRVLTEMNYKYEGENLIEVSGQTQGSGSPETTKMEYQNGIMKSSSYYRKNTKYHYREFFYDESGLKTRTEIYNVYGEPEYTITYDYEYY